MSTRLSLVVFSAAGQWFGIESAAVRGRNSSKTLPHAVNRQVDFCDLLGQEDQPSDQWLRLAGSNQDWFLGLSGDMDLIELPGDRIHPLPPLLAARLLFKPLRALSWYQQQPLLLLEPVLLGALAEEQLAAAEPANR